MTANAKPKRFDWSDVRNQDPFLSALGRTGEVGGRKVDVLFEDGVNDDRSSMQVRSRFRIQFKESDADVLTVGAELVVAGKTWKLNHPHSAEVPGWLQVTLMEVRAQ